VYTPVLQRAFSTEALSRRDWLVCAAVASSVLWIREIQKGIARRFGRQAGGRVGADHATVRKSEEET
jgi:Ca2+-transporting ATPase